MYGISRATMKITKLSIREAQCKVYNLEVKENPTYYANGILVHNCRSTTISVTTYEPPVILSKGAVAGVEPQKGFAGSVRGMVA